MQEIRQETKLDELIGELERKLKTLRTMKELLGNSDLAALLQDFFGRRETGPEPPVAPPVPTNGTITRASAAPAYHMPHRGLQAQVLRALHTGPATSKEIASLMLLDETAVKQSLDHLVNREWATRLPGGWVQLATAGVVPAKWLMEHPRAKMYAPNSVGRKQKEVA